MFNFCGIVSAILKMETGRHFSMSGINSGRWNRTILNLCGIVVAILKMATSRNLSMSGIISGHHNLPTYEMSLKSDNVEFVRYCGWPFWKWPPVEFFQCRESIRDIIIYPHIKFWWYRTMLNFYRILANILKKADISKNFKTQNFSSNGDLSLCQILCLYHYTFRSYQY